MRHELKDAIRRDKRTQRQIAKDAGIHEVTLSRVVGGASFDHSTGEAIARTLGRTMAEVGLAEHVESRAA